MTHVSLISAPPVGPNPGMASVDLAFDEIRRELGLETTMWRLWDAEEIRLGRPEHGPSTFVDGSTGLEYESLRGRLKEALDTDILLYWGDFHHMAAYHRMVDHHLSRIGIPLEPERVGREYLLLDGVDVPDSVEVVSFGSTLVLNTSDDYAGQYGELLTAFLDRLSGASFRDPYSSHVAASVSSIGRTGGSCLGMDPAVLLSRPTSRTADRDGLGVFFGRSRVRAELLGLFTETLGRRVSLRPRWIPWGHHPAFWPVGVGRRFRLACPSLRFDGGFTEGCQSPAIEIVESLGDYRAIVTDTYHLALNAWCQGVPAICVVEAGEQAEHRVNAGDRLGYKDKRAQLYTMLDATDYLVRSSCLRPQRVRATTKEAAERLLDENAVSTVAERVQGLAQHGKSIVRRLLT